VTARPRKRDTRAHTDRETERQRDRERQTETERDRERERERQRERGGGREIACMTLMWRVFRKHAVISLLVVSMNCLGHSYRGSWIMVSRTRYGDDYVRLYYQERGVRQLVLLGAGFDARAYRMQGLDELRVFEVDQQTTFDVKEALLVDETLAFASRSIVATEFTERGRWALDLQAAGLNTSLPTIWLLEGLLMYLSLEDTHVMMVEIGALSAVGSAVFQNPAALTIMPACGRPMLVSLTVTYAISNQ